MSTASADSGLCSRCGGSLAPHEAGRTPGRCDVCEQELARLADRRNPRKLLAKLGPRNPR